MQVSRTLDYALRSLTYMGARPVMTYNIREISAQQHIPLNYLAKIMRKLVMSGIVASKVGPDGGYSLLKTPHEIKLRDVYEAIEGKFKLVDCMDNNVICSLYEYCPQIPVWDKLQLSMLKVLENTTLEDLLKEQRNRSPRGRRTP